MAVLALAAFVVLAFLAGVGLRRLVLRILLGDEWGRAREEKRLDREANQRWRKRWK